ncbi:hypothetical protein LOK49_LG13G02384 [Camellia lanceoleosa]|uniref:Uncharacterized protein n=1 Tax=Camellia lanceoleosa TaxID=1840588 RepID=A0ACC0FKF8_9ERIC|nr:hypothetical protein LOK49_LG13G02384 [Camellia lanceoleosa]
MAAETKTTVVKVKPSSQDGSSKPKFDSSLTKKKISESSIKRPVDSKSKSTTTVPKTEVKVKTASSSSKTTSSSSMKTTTVKMREKKVYSLPGQKYDVPEEVLDPLHAFSCVPLLEIPFSYKVPLIFLFCCFLLTERTLRIFYESLSKQIPSSEMAEFWMMEHSMLPLERAKKAYEKEQRKQKQLRMGTPIKSPPPRPPSRPESSKKQQLVSKNGEVKAKKRIVDSDDDDDFILSPKRRKV